MEKVRRKKEKAKKRLEKEPKEKGMNCKKKEQAQRRERLQLKIRHYQNKYKDTKIDIEKAEGQLGKEKDRKKVKKVQDELEILFPPLATWQQKLENVYRIY